MTSAATYKTRFQAPQLAVTAWLFTVSILGPGCDGSVSSRPPGSAGAISVTGTMAGSLLPLTLSPDFSPDIHDYTVRCSPGVNSFDVALTAPDGGAVAVIAPLLTDAAAEATLRVNLTEDQAMEVQTSAPGQEPQQYNVRCLPHDFPTTTLTAYPDRGQATPGWYLLGNTVVGSGESGFAMILDPHGTPVWYRRATAGVLGVQQVAANTVAFTTLVTPSSPFLFYHLDSGQSESVQAEGLPTDVHELLPLPSGNRMLISYPLNPGVDLTGLQAYGPGSTLVDCVVQEVDPAGHAVWQWRATDHIDPIKESTFPMTSLIAGQSTVDAFHCNSVDVDDSGNVLVSARHLDSVFLIEKATGTIKWKLGGAAYSKDAATILQLQDAANAAFYRQHDARFLPGGVISLFDDHSGVPGVARGVEYALNLTQGTAQLVHQYPGEVSTLFMGSYRHYPDGSCLVGWGARDPSSTLAFSEFNEAGVLLLDLGFGPGDYSYRALKVPLSDFDPAVLRKAVGQP